MGSPDRVAEDCKRLRRHLESPLTASNLEHLLQLLPLLRKRTGAIAVPLYDLLEEATKTCSDPWLILEGMLSARNSSLVIRALQTLMRLAESGALTIDFRVVNFLAEKVETEGSPLSEIDTLRKIAGIISHLLISEPNSPLDSVLALYLKQKDEKIRRLAARLLDLNEEPVSQKLSEQLIGKKAYTFLAPYLAFTRATHLDLLYLLPIPGSPAPALPSLRQAEKVLGKDLLREIITKLGWQRVNFGLQVRQFIGVSVGGSFPLMLSPTEALLFERCRKTRRISETCLIIAHGGTSAGSHQADTGIDPVARFRTMNLLHAELLADILDLTPLTKEKVRSILVRMNKIVEDFITLFASYSEECTILPGVYQELKRRILTELVEEQGQPQLSAELTRLVLMFDDPSSLGEVQSIHGLKRYLHQKGLQLGFRIVEMGRTTNRTVDLLITSQERILLQLKKFRYVEFDPETECIRPPTHIPYPVAIAVEGFARQLFFGQENFPQVDIFCYGNEIHYFLSFLNHPVFLRIDYAPPLQGGMIDLEYFGISKYEMSLHPNVSLDAIRFFFQRLDFDVQIEGTRVHARYDKERALHLGDLCEKAEALFRLAPYLMDIDWIIGNLNLDNGVRRKVAEAWAESFTLRGVLPLCQLLTEDRQGIIEALETDAAGEREVVWSGKGPYRDIFSVRLSGEFFDQIGEVLQDLGLGTLPLLQENISHSLGQIHLERCLLNPLRKAVERSEIIETSRGFHLASTEHFQREHEAERFAHILANGNEALASAASLGQLLAPLERTLRFCTTGNLGSFEVQHAILPLRGENLNLYVLRDGKEIIRLAIFAQEEVLFRRRKDTSSPWKSNARSDVGEMAALLRRHNYMSPKQEPVTEKASEEVRKIKDTFKKERLTPRQRFLPEEHIITGLKASPGRAVGRVLFGTSGRVPEDFDGIVLVSSAVRPEDNAFIYHSAGIVSTGGGILSHAGLIATQFHKPALIISGRWQQQDDGSRVLLYHTIQYQEEEREIKGYLVSIRRDLQEREHFLREGDLVVLDAWEGTLCVLGQNPDALALHEGFRLFSKTVRELARVATDREILALRGRRLRARYQIEKLLRRLTDPVLARYAVYELLLGELFSEHEGSRSERIHLLIFLLDNPVIGEAVRNNLIDIVRKLEHRYQTHYSRAEECIPSSPYPFEVIALRLEVCRIRHALGDAAACLQECGLEVPFSEPYPVSAIDLISYHRLKELRAKHECAVRELTATGIGDARLRHLLRQLKRLDLLLETQEKESKPLDIFRVKLFSEDQEVRQRHQDKYLLGAEDSGFELFSVIGWKAANLAEIERLGGRGLVPSWFVVTDKAFREVLDTPMEKIALPTREISLNASTLREAIDAIIARSDLDSIQKSKQISNLWEGIRLPDELAKEVLAAYRRITSEIPSESHPDGYHPMAEEEDRRQFVALRSSAREEDVETAARAGEFDTFLFIRGEESLLTHLKRTWSGLWTERAIHNRTVLDIGIDKAGGGVIIQRMVWSRVSGVLMTVNAAKSDPREIVINAGLGLGEGIVSGIITADQITVSKEGDLEKGPLCFKYVTSDKREKVVFNQRAGFGTVRNSTLAHQRLRPALEYMELCELVRTAARLEAAYGYPLDIEFAIEGRQLWILQARPVATFLTVLRETIEHYPLTGRMGVTPFSPPKEILS